ncbi:uncharacterized protein LOC119456760 [Dermacentor silvarum]|uniref:uncharacterized protein LOC119456760 n=1 Tax=Dermacentor silvarum TaxID=543639 RepID=UPI002100FDED|nr:uncharacterized protein LOC119456760 [Dermacentor silvarum]
MNSGAETTGGPKPIDITVTSRVCRPTLPARAPKKTGRERERIVLVPVTSRLYIYIYVLDRVLTVSPDSRFQPQVILVQGGGMGVFSQVYAIMWKDVYVQAIKRHYLVTTFEVAMIFLAFLGVERDRPLVAPPTLCDKPPCTRLSAPRDYPERNESDFRAPQLCRSYATEPGVGLHTYPQFKKLHEAWIAKLKTGKQPSATTQLCSKHFHEEAFCYASGLRCSQIMQEGSRVVFLLSPDIQTHEELATNTVFFFSQILYAPREHNEKLVKTAFPAGGRVRAQGYDTEQDLLRAFYHFSPRPKRGPEQRVVALVFGDTRGKRKNDLEFTVRFFDDADYITRRHKVFALFSTLPNPVTQRESVAYCQIALVRAKTELMRQAGGETNAARRAYRMTTRRFSEGPLPEDALSALWIMAVRIGIGYLVTFSTLVGRLAEEAQTGMREKLRLAGLHDAIYWLGHFMAAMFKGLVSIACIMGYMTTVAREENGRSATFLQDTNKTVVFVSLVLFSFQYVTTAMVLSLFFANNTVAILFAMCYWITAYAAPWLALEDFDGLSAHYIMLTRSTKLMTSLLPCMALHWCYRIIGCANVVGEQYGLSSVSKYVLELDNVTMLEIWTVMVAYSTLMCVAIWYLGNVLSWARGVPLAPWFPVSPSYWLPSRQGAFEKLPPEAPDDVHFEQYPPDKEEAIFVNRLEYEKEHTHVLRNTSFKAYPNELLVVIGPSGSGKSSLVRIVTGMEKPSDGQVIVEGFDVTSQTASARASMGVVLQRTVLFGDLTAYEHLLFFGSLGGLLGGELVQRAVEVTDMMLLTELSCVLTSNMTRSAKRRLDLAIAILLNPTVLILDEPVFGMDIESRYKVWDVLNNVKQKTCVVMTTSDIDDVDTLGDRVAILGHGGLKCFGTPAFLRHRYGCGYNLHVTKAPNFQTSRLVLALREASKDARLLQDHKRFAILSLGEQQDYAPVSDALLIVERRQVEYAIQSYRVCVITIADVFLRVIMELDTGSLDSKRRAAALNRSRLGADKQHQHMGMTTGASGAQMTEHTERNMVMATANVGGVTHQEHDKYESSLQIERHVHALRDMVAGKPRMGQIFLAMLFKRRQYTRQTLSTPLACWLLPSFLMFIVCRYEAGAQEGLTLRFGADRLVYDLGRLQPHTDVLLARDSASSETAKYDYVMSALSPTTIALIRDVLLTPPPDNPYDILKRGSLRRTTDSESRRIRQLLSSEELSDRKPTELLRRMTLLLGGNSSSTDSKNRPRTLHEFSVYRIGLEYEKEHTHVLRNTSFKAYPNELLVVIGPSGSGKSSLVRIVTGMEKPSDGQVIVEGFDVTSQTASARASMGVVLQRTVLFGDLTAYEHLLFFGSLGGLLGGELVQRAVEVTDMMLLTELSCVLTSNMTRSAKRRLDLAIAILLNPTVLILDEPVFGMDIESRYKVWDVLNNVKQKTCVVMTTSDIDDVDTLGDRVAILGHGGLKCFGTPAFLRHRYGCGYNLHVTKAPNFQTSRLVLALREASKDARLLQDHKRFAILSLGEQQDYAPVSDALLIVERRQVEYAIQSYRVCVITIADVFLRVIMELDTGSLDSKRRAAALNRSRLGADKQHQHMGMTTGASGAQMTEHTERNMVMATANVGGVTHQEHDKYESSLQIERHVHALHDMVAGKPRMGQIFLAMLFKRRQYTRQTLSTPLACWLLPSFLMFIVCRYEAGAQEGLTLRFGADRLVYDLGRLQPHTDVLLARDSASSEVADSIYRPYAHSKSLTVRTVPSMDKYMAQLKLDKSAPMDTLAGAQFVAEDGGGANAASGRVVAWYHGDAYHTQSASADLVGSALLRWASHDPKASMLSMLQPMRRRNYSIYSRTLRRYDVAKELHAVLSQRLMRFVLLPAAMSVTAASFVLFAIEDRVSKSKDMQLVSGVPPLVYWMGNYVWDMLMSLISLVCMFFPITLCFPQFISIAPAVISIFMAYVHSVLAFVYWFSFFMDSTLAGFILVNIVTSLTGTVAGLTYQLSLIGNEQGSELLMLDPPRDLLLWQLYLLPPFSYTWALIKTMEKVSEERYCTGDTIDVRDVCAYVHNSLEEGAVLLPNLRYCCANFYASNMTSVRLLPSFSFHRDGILTELLVMVAEGCVLLLLLALYEKGFFRSWNPGRVDEATAASSTMIASKDVPADVASEARHVQKVIAAHDLNKPALLVLDLNKRLQSISVLRGPHLQRGARRGFGGGRPSRLRKVHVAQRALGQHAAHLWHGPNWGRATAEPGRVGAAHRCLSLARQRARPPHGAPDAAAICQHQGHPAGRHRPPPGAPCPPAEPHAIRRRDGRVLRRRDAPQVGRGHRHHRAASRGADGRPGHWAGPDVQAQDLPNSRPAPAPVQVGRPDRDAQRQRLRRHV